MQERLAVSIMDIQHGYNIDNPNIVVPMGITPRFLKRLFTDYPLKMVTPEYFVAECTSLSGLKHNLGFHFTPIFPKALTLTKRLYRLELFRTENDLLYLPESQTQSFTDFQTRLEIVFGSPTKSVEGTEGFPNHEWHFGNITIGHSVYEHFVMRESVGISISS